MIPEPPDGTCRHRAKFAAAGYIPTRQESTDA